MARLAPWHGCVRALGLFALLLTVVSTALLSRDVALGPIAAAAASGPSVDAADFPTIQAAVDSLEVTGGTVRLAAGTHLLPAKLRVYSNVTLAGAGLDRTILKFAPGVEDHLVSNASLSKGNSNILIRDLTLQGQKTTKADCCFGLRLVNVRDSLVLNVAADGFSRDGFYLGYYRENGVYNTRLSGCRATNNGRNGISLTHGSGNIVDGCRVENNNQAERVAGIDLEPDDGLAVTGNKLVGNSANGQNVGIQLYSFDRARAVIRDNVVCRNSARDNRNAGIWENNATADIFVDNTTRGNGNNFLVDRSAKQGSAYASSCDLPPLPGITPTPSPSPTATPRATATPPVRTLSTASHTLTAGSITRSAAQLTSRVAVLLGGQPVGKGARVTIQLTRPDGSTSSGRGTTNGSGELSLRFKVNRAGEYRARVASITLGGAQFVATPADEAAPATVAFASRSSRPARGAAASVD